MLTISPDADFQVFDAVGKVVFVKPNGKDYLWYSGPSSIISVILQIVP